MEVPIHETAEWLPSMHDLIEKLTEMLEQYQVSYCVALPSAEKRQKSIYKLYYLSEQDTELTLIVFLFTCLYPNRNKQEILEKIVKSFGRSA